MGIAQSRKFIITTIGTVGLIFLGAVLFNKLGANKKSTIGGPGTEAKRRMVTVSKFEEQNLANKIRIDGRLVAVEAADLTTKVSGLLKSTTTKVIKEGTAVRKGEVLFQIDDTEAKFALVAQRSTLLNAIAQMLPDLKYDLPSAFDKWSSYLAQIQVEKTLPTLPTTQSDQEKYFVSLRNIFNIYYTIRSAETRLADYQITAPFDGVITVAPITAGAMVNPGTRLASIISDRNFELVASISSFDAASITIGQAVNLKNDLGEELRGTIRRIGSKLDPTTQMIPIYIGVAGSNLKEGAFLSGTIQGKPLTRVYEIGKNVFSDQHHVFVVQDSLVSKKRLETIKRQDDHVIVRGLSSADLVITGSLAGIYEGQKVDYQINNR